MEAYEQILQSFQVLKYGHLANGLILLLSMIFKRQEKRNTAETLQILVISAGYGYPILKAIYTFKMYHLDDLFQKSDMACWINFEILFFLFWIVSLQIFLFLGYWFKYKSIRKGKIDDNFSINSSQEYYNSLWSSKNSDDFLRYLKWEAFTYGYLFSMLFMDIYVALLNPQGEVHSNNITYALSILLIKRTLTVIMFTFQL